MKFSQYIPRTVTNGVTFPWRCLAIITLLWSAGWFADSAEAQIVNWQNAAGGWWDSNSNWAGGTRPGAAATARFGVNNTYNVDWESKTGNPTTAGLQVAAGNVTFRSQGGPTYRHTVSGETLVETGGIFNLGAAATNRFNLDTGSLKLQSGGILNVKFGSVLTSSGNVIVGHTGTGSQLNITGGSIVNINNGAYTVIGGNSGATGSALISGASSHLNASGEVWVGDFGNGTLTIDSGGRVSSGRAYISLRGSSTSTATVTGAGSRWTTSAEFTVGDTGNGTLDVLDGGLVSNTTGYVGRNTGAVGLLHVSGTNSRWNSSTGLFVGAQDAVTNGGVGSVNVASGGRIQVGNDTFDSGTGSEMVIGDTVAANGSMVVRNGSTVSNTGQTYIGATSGRTGSALVTGSGSQWTNSGDFIVGSSGNGSLNVEAGGLVSSGDSFVGLSSGSVGTVTVSGSGSQWNTSAYANIGRSGSGTLNIQGGGTATMGIGYLGFESTGTGVIHVTGAGSRLTTTLTNGAGLYVGHNGTGTLNITDGGRVQIGSDTFSSGTASQMVLGDNSISVGTMNVFRGTVNNAGSAYIGATSGKSGRADVNGVNAGWTNATGLYLGAQNATTNGGFGALYVVNGGRLQVGNDLFDGGTTAELVIGDTVTSNGTLTIRNGSFAEVSGNSYLGATSGKTGSALVSGVNSRWVTYGNLNVGQSGTGNLNVENGGYVYSITTNIGLNAGSVGIANVTGSNSRLAGTNLLIGAQNATTDGGSGALNISSGGRVQVGNDGFDSGTNSELVVGGGTLTVRNGATISNDGSSYIGPSTSGTATITGDGSTWTSATGLFVGAQSTTVNGHYGTLNVMSGGRIQVGDDSFDSGSGAEMVIGDTVPDRGVFAVRSGAVTNAGSSYIGATSGKTGSAVVSGSTWSSGTGLFLGGPNATTDGGVGTLSISGGRVQIGNDTGGAGVVVGDTVAANGTLIVRNGSTISNTGQAYIGATSGRTGSALVTGSGSQWTNSGDFIVGGSGNGSLNVEAGGLVSSGDSFVGLSSGSVGTVTVSGSGSQWNTSAYANIGRSGSGTLNIQGGGTATMGIGYLGFESTGTGVIHVTGAGSRLTTTLTNGAGLYVGHNGTGTLNITDGGRVQIGSDTFSSGTASQMVLGDNSIAVGTMNVFRGTVNNAGSAYIGATSGKSGRADVNGVNAGWTNATGLYLGAQNATTNGGFGALYVVNGGRLQVGNDLFDGGTTAELVIGDTVTSNGTLTIRNGSVAEVFGNSYLGATSGKTGSALVSGANSRWHNGNLSVGHSGNGTLIVENGGYANGSNVNIGFNAGSSGIATVTGTNSRLFSNILYVGHSGDGTLSVENGGYASANTVHIGFNSDSLGSVKVTGANASLNSGLLNVGVTGAGELNIENGGIVINSTGYVGFNSAASGTVNVSGNGSLWRSGNGVFLGAQSTTVDGGNGALNITSGGRVQVGNDSFDSGTNSELVISDLNVIANGTLTLRNGSSIANDGSSYLAASANSLGSALVSGAGSRWENSGDLYVGRSGAGNLSVANGGVVENDHGHIASHGGSSTATVTGAGSHWANAGNLSVGAAGVGNLNINDAGLVTVSGTTTIGADDSVTLSGGRFEFGTSSLTSFARMGGSSGELAGLVTNTAFTNISTFTPLQSSDLDLGEVNLLNSGTIIGTGSVLTGFANTTVGRVDATGSSAMRFEGDNNVNHGRINSTGGLVSMAGNLTNTGTGRVTNLGGQIVSEGQVTNMAGGLISGRGEFTAEGGFHNHGTMAFSGGFADVVGDVHNFAGSLIVTSGNATTTFFEDVVHNGAEIRTSADSATVFLGEVSGAGSFTGTGSVFFEGDLRPGNSPGIVSFGGDVIFGATATSHFEIGGLLAGINGFDQLQITGDLFLNDSMLNVSFINSFSLGSNQKFLIAAVGGTVNGQFQGLGEGALVGNYSGTDLFITYSAGGGNGIALFSAVPEPSALLLVGGLIGLTGLRRRRQLLHA